MRTPVGILLCAVLAVAVIAVFAPPAAPGGDAASEPPPPPPEGEPSPSEPPAPPEVPPPPPPPGPGDTTPPEPPPPETEKPPPTPPAPEDEPVREPTAPRLWGVRGANGKWIPPPWMTVIPDGEFQMGATDQSGDRLTRDVIFTPIELPVRWVPKRAFAIDLYEVTNAEYARFIAETRYEEPFHWEQGRYPPGMPRHPVVGVRFADAVAFAAWRSGRDGITYRLPYEDEWEKAARGKDGRLWPWGNTFDSRNCNTVENPRWPGPPRSGEIRTLPVGSFAGGVSPYGLYDCAGNVWEWTQSWYDRYPNSTAIDRDFGQRFRIVRGGSWNYRKDRALCARRSKEREATQAYDIGFRLVVDIPAPPPSAPRAPAPSR